MAMEYLQFEDVFPIEHVDFPSLMLVYCVFRNEGMAGAHLEVYLGLIEGGWRQTPLKPAVST